MKLEAKNIEGFLRRPDPAVQAVLVYGVDEGLARERVETLARHVVDDLADPFRVVSLTAKDLTDDGARLADEAAAIAMTGGRRVILIRGADSSLKNLFAEFLAAPVGDALILLQGSDMPRKAALVKLFEGAANAAAMPCYGDEEKTLPALIRGHMENAGLKIDGDALAYLAANLGSDRMTTRRELEKLALYMANDSGGTVSLADAEASVGDSAARHVEDMTDAALGGDLRRLETGLARHLMAGDGPIPVLRTLSRQLMRLHLAAGRVAQGESPDKAMAALRPPVFWKHKKAFQDQLRMWSPDKLANALRIVLEAEEDCKSTGMPGEAVCGRVLLRIATGARRR